MQRRNERKTDVSSEIGNVDARRDADVFLEILLSEGPIYPCRETGRGKQKYVPSLPMKRQEGPW
jgi:hypothetical protein